MLTLYVPAVNDMIMLAEDWTFPLFAEYRNIGLCAVLKPNVDWRDTKNCFIGDPYRSDLAAIQATLPKGTILSVNRVYIRAGSSAAFNSLTFRVVSVPEGCGLAFPEAKTVSARILFWVKLADVNGLKINEPGTFEIPKLKTTRKTKAKA